MSATGYPDIDWWLTHDGGPDIDPDGPLAPTDEMSGDATIWRSEQP